MEEVEYLTIERFPGYRFGSDGSVWSCVKTGPVKNRVFGQWKKLSDIPNCTGYVSVALHIVGKKATNYQVHRLILEAFKGQCPYGMEACHKNGNRGDNNILNLRWGTHHSNEADKLLCGTHNRGERHGMSKFTEEQVKAIREEYVPWLVTQAYLGRKYGVSREAISKVLLGTRWPHVP